MSLILPVNIPDLLHCSGVESARIEFKASWDEGTTGFQVLKTICAFANDLQNLNGGYIVIGVAEQNGCAVLPPQGIPAEKLDGIQRWIRGNCNRIDPEYQPIMSPEIVDGKRILVVWAPASDIRPHKAPDGERGRRKYFVRIGSESVDAERNGVLKGLLELTARVPFDDRRALNARIEDIREAKVREFLRDIRSGLLEEDNTRDLYRKLKIAVPLNDHDVPKNIGLLFFTDNPEDWFTGSRIEVVQYAADASGDVIEERVFTGGIHEQLKAVLTYLEQFSISCWEKQPSSFRVKGWVSYPIPALREALVNAVYHRGYDTPPEPIKVYLYPERIEIISYPGPVQGITMAHLRQEAPIPPVPARNRRIGEFLKELRLAEGRGTGIPKLYRAMRENDSPDPTFDFDDGRTYFRVTLPAHPEYMAISALRDAAHLRAIGKEEEASLRLKTSWDRMQGSPTLTAELIRTLGAKERIEEAKQTFTIFKESTKDAFIPYVTNVLLDVLLIARRENEAKDLLEQLPEYIAGKDALDTAILARRMNRHEAAHRYFERAGDFVFGDARALHEFGQVKIRLAQKAYHQGGRRRFARETNERLLREAREILERVIQMDADRTRHAWTWRDLGRVKRWLRFPRGEIKNAYERAMELQPEEQRFKDELRKLDLG